MFYPQNGDRILAIDCMTSLHPMFSTQWYRRLSMKHNAVGTEQFGTVQTFRLGVLLTARQRHAYVALRKPATYVTTQNPANSFKQN